MIAVVSFGVCNVGSILNMLRKIEADAVLVSTPAEIDKADKIILPGIGAFDNGVRALSSLGLVEPLRRRAGIDKVPILGICLGMQLLARSSEEGTAEGIGLIDGKSVRFQPTQALPIKVPHMGWNSVVCRKPSPLWHGLDERPRFYFVHSYHLACGDPADVLGSAVHGIEFTAMVQRENVYGVQFHPEKSHRFGMALLKNFAAI